MRNAEFFYDFQFLFLEVNCYVGTCYRYYSGLLRAGRRYGYDRGYRPRYRFGISGNLSLRPNYLLSGGQKSRVALALIMLDNPQILLMDEPTNHLDLDAINALVVALSSYEGGLLIVSHDQNFVEQVCTQIYKIENKKLSQFRGNFNDYRKYLRDQSDKNKQFKLK